MRKRLSILGSTGSIGQATLDVVSRHPDRFEVIGLAEGHDIIKLSEQIKKFKPKVVSVRDEESLKNLKKLGVQCEVLCGIEGASAVATIAETDLVVSAIVGAVGLKPTYDAIKAGKDIALANKETLVAAGELVMNAVREKGVRLIPIDSEHSAIFQSLVGHNRKDVKRIILTASGGPFRTWPTERIEKATVSEALSHPNWSMGAKITIDSATLMNKGLEVIEARWLFDIEPARLNVVVHPESIIHSMVEYVDGSVVAQMAVPDMRGPIAYAISYPNRIDSGLKELDLTEVGRLTFERPDMERFPCLRLARAAIESGGSMPAVLNAANEVAVEAFLKERISFPDIPRVVERVMERHEGVRFSDIKDVIAVDKKAREMAGELIGRI